MPLVSTKSRRSGSQTKRQTKRQQAGAERLCNRMVAYAAKIGVPNALRGPIAEVAIRYDLGRPATTQWLPALRVMRYPAALTVFPDLLIVFAEQPTPSNPAGPAEPGFWVFRHRRHPQSDRRLLQLRHDGDDAYRFTKPEQIAAVADHPADLR